MRLQVKTNNEQLVYSKFENDQLVYLKLRKVQKLLCLNLISWWEFVLNCLMADGRSDLNTKHAAASEKEGLEIFEI